MTDIHERVDPDLRKISVPILAVQQPIGEMYIASINHKDLQLISHFDVRRVIQEERDIEKYLGIQRPLDDKRVRQLNEYVNFVDASFPSSIILAIDDEYVDVKDGEMEIRNHRINEVTPSIMLSTVARVLDGQHRIAGLETFNGEHFDVSATIFVGSDIADQAYIFATVNLEQTKVRKSLAYDLFALSQSRSPQKVCHNIAVTLDRDKKSPFHEKVKRLGVTTPGRTKETLTQATFVEGLLSLISKHPKEDRDLLLRGKTPPSYEGNDFERFALRQLFLDEKDMALTATINNFFAAVQERWPLAWSSNATGLMLNRTSGYRALIRFLRNVYLQEAGIGNVLTQDHCRKYFNAIERSDNYFNTDTFKPGSTGEGELFRLLMRESGLE